MFFWHRCVLGLVQRSLRQNHESCHGHTHSPRPLLNPLPRVERMIRETLEAATRCGGRAEAMSLKWIKKGEHLHWERILELHSTGFYLFWLQNQYLRLKRGGCFYREWFLKCRPRKHDIWLHGRSPSIQPSHPEQNFNVVHRPSSGIVLDVWIGTAYVVPCPFSLPGPVTHLCGGGSCPTESSSNSAVIVFTVTLEGVVRWRAMARRVEGP